METYEDLYKTICRVCLSYGNKENMVCLIDNNSDDGLSCFGKAVVVFAKVLINVNDDLPKCMCGNCLKILKHAIYFKLKCESSDKKLSNLSKNHTSGSNLKEKIIDYLLFTQFLTQESFSRDSSVDLKDKPNDSNNEPNDSYNEPKDIDNKSTNDLENSCFEIDNLENDTEIGAFMDSADEELEALEKLVSRSTSSSNKHRVRRKQSKLQEKESQNKPPRKRTIRQTEKKKFICKICQKELSNQHTYKYHMERHYGCKFMCEHCGKGFPLLMELNMHQVSRHGTGMFLQCPHCTYKAPRKLNLVEHIRIHTGERPYTCDKCGLTFRRSAIWKKHMVYHSEKTVQCPQCPKKFYRRGEMLAHANNIHERMYMYLCHKCDATYAKTETVRRHLLERHGIPREMQGKIVRINKGRGMEFSE